MLVKHKNNSIEPRTATPVPETTETALYGPFHDWLVPLNDDDKGRLAFAVIYSFFHPKPRSRGEHDVIYLS